MSEKIAQLNEEVIKGQIKELVRGSVEGDAQRSAGSGAGETDAGGTLRAQQGTPGLPQRSL